MSILPVVAREMSVLARRRSTYITRALTAALAMFVIGWIFLVAVAGMSVAQIGQAVFMGLASLCFVYALLAGIHATSDAISEEKREGTLGLLFLTDLKSYDITLGKLTATSLSSFYALLSVIPTLAFAILLGGVAMADVARVSLVLVNTMFLSLSLGILVSALSTNERRSILTSFLLLAALTIGPFILTMVLTDFEKLPTLGVCISPIYPFMCAFDPNIPDFETKLFYPALIIQHCLAWLCLVRATFLLPSLAHGVALKWRDRFAAAFDQYAYGSVVERKTHRAKLLDRNAFLWLAARERVKPFWAWIIIAIFFVLYLWVAWGFRGILFDLHTSAALLFLVHLVIKLWVTSEVCTRVIQDRRSGAFELLLSSPLSVREIASGQHLALKRILGKPVFVLVLTEIFLMFLALRFMNKPAPADRVLTYLAAISTLLLDLWALKWLGMWLSLFGKSIERVLIATTARIMFAPSILFLALGALLAATLVFHGRRPEYRELLLSWWFFGVVFSISFGSVARRNFLRHCREAVSDQHESPASLAKAAFAKRQSAASVRPYLPAFVLRRPVVSAMTAAVILLVAGVLARRIYWGSELASKVGAIQARNEPTKILEVPKTYAAIPNDENAFAELGRAGAVNRFLGRGVDLRVLHLAGSNYLHGLDATNRNQYASVLKNNQMQFSAFEKLTLYTNAYIDAVGDYRPLRTTDLYGYVELSLVDLMLAADARDVPRLERALERLLHYAKLLRAQPSWYAQYAAGSLLDRLSTAFEPIIYRRLLSDSSLGRLQTMTAKVDSVDVPHRLLLITRALALDPPEELQRYRFGQDKLAATITRIFTEASGVHHQQLVKVLDRFERALAINARSHPEQLAWASGLSALNQGMNPPPSLEQLHDAQIRDVLLRNLRIVTYIRLLETVLAIERYSHKHGEYPTSLEALVPEFLPSPPIDPFSGAVFKWNYSSDGPMLWSVGPNGQNDDGAVGFNGSADLTFHFWNQNRE